MTTSFRLRSAPADSRPRPLVRDTREARLDFCGERARAAARSAAFRYHDWLPASGALLMLLAAACQGPASAPEPGREAAAKPLSFVYVSPDPLGVNTFLLLGQKGLEAAGARHGAVTKVLESEDPTTRSENVRWAVQNGADIVIVLGFEFADILAELAPSAPSVRFLIVDQCIADAPPNVHCAVFREHEAAFLLGAVAAWMSQTRHVGTIGALDIPFLHRYADGLAAGARYVDPRIRVSTLWVGGESPFSDPARAKEQALAMAGSGADIILAAAAAGNFGIFEAAQEKGFLVFGIDVNQCPSAPGRVVDNLTKRVDQAIVDSVAAILDGTAPPLKAYGLGSGGLGLVSLAPDASPDSQCLLAGRPEILRKARELEQRIITGEIRIPDPMAGP